MYFTKFALLDDVLTEYSMLKRQIPISTMSSYVNKSSLTFLNFQLNKQFYILLLANIAR